MEHILYQSIQIDKEEYTIQEMDWNLKIGRKAELNLSWKAIQIFLKGSCDLTRAEQKGGAVTVWSGHRAVVAPEWTEAAAPASLAAPTRLPGSAGGTPHSEGVSIRLPGSAAHSPFCTRICNSWKLKKKNQNQNNFLETSVSISLKTFRET